MLRSGVDFPAIMKLLGHASPDMTMLYLDIALTDLQRELHLARSQPRHLVPQPKTQLASRAGLEGVIDSLLTARSTRNGDVPAQPARCRSPPLPGPSLQPPYQNPLASPQTRRTRKIGRDWPDIAILRPLSPHIGAAV